MKTLDRYIIRQFLVNVAILMVVLLLLFVVIDLIVGLDAFVSAAQDRVEEQGGSVLLSTIAFMIDYYAPVSVMIYVFFVNVPVLGAMGFTFAALQRSGELTAMVASGLSMYRLALPIIVAGLALNALVLPIQELIIPDLAPKLIRSKSQVQYETLESFPVRFVRDDQGRLFTAAGFDAAESRLDGLTVLQRDTQGLAAQRITAETATWDADHQGWRLEPVGQIVELTGDAQPDAAIQTHTTDFISTDLSPTIITARQAREYARFLSMAQLQRMQQNEAVDHEQRAQISRIVWSRFSMLVVNVLVLVMGMTFFLQLGHVNLLGQAIKTAAVCLTAWGGAMLIIQTGDLFNPAAMAWLPVALLLPVTALMLQTIRT